MSSRKQQEWFSLVTPRGAKRVGSAELFSICFYSAISSTTLSIIILLSFLFRVCFHSTMLSSSSYIILILKRINLSVWEQKYNPTVISGTCWVILIRLCLREFGVCEIHNLFMKWFITLRICGDSKQVSRTHETQFQQPLLAFFE